MSDDRPRPPLLAGDADRERAAAVLAEEYVAGRLTLDELSDRLERVYRATAVRELHALTHDLASPSADAQPAAARWRAPRRPFWPGNLPFATGFRTRASAKVVHDQAMQTVVPRLLAAGYHLESDRPRAVVLGKASRPGWTILVSILLFPIGLLALSQKDHSRVVISIGRDGDETTVELVGRAPLGVRRAAHALGRDHTR